MGQQTPNYSVRYGEHALPYQIKPRQGTSAKILIKVHADQSIEVSAPVGAAIDDVQQAVKQRARWIYTQWRGFAEQRAHVSPRQYVSGETHYYLGRQHLLKVLIDPEQATRIGKVKLLRGRLHVYLPQASDDPIAQSMQVKQLLDHWYRQRADIVFSQRLDALMPQLIWLNQRPTLRLMVMRTQWGSCSPQGVISINPHLVKAKRDAIDYVLLHELCHLAEHNHSERFYRLLSQIMPNWQIVKAQLDAKADDFLYVD